MSKFYPGDIVAYKALGYPKFKLRLVISNSTGGNINIVSIGRSLYGQSVNNKESDYYLISDIFRGEIEIPHR